MGTGGQAGLQVVSWGKWPKDKDREAAGAPAAGGLGSHPDVVKVRRKVISHLRLWSKTNGFKRQL